MHCTCTESHWKATTIDIALLLWQNSLQCIAQSHIAKQVQTNLGRKNVTLVLDNVMQLFAMHRNKDH